jgi:hypothetical protein
MSGKYRVGMGGGWNWLRIVSTEETVLNVPVLLPETIISYIYFQAYKLSFLPQN